MPGKFNRLNKRFTRFIEEQRLFFVATADREGRVNLSPKGLDSLRVLAEDRIVWLSVSGSGNETAAHVRHHDRMTLMFCAFEGDALILRVYGHAQVVHPHDEGWADLVGLFPSMAGTRQIFDLHIDLVQTSCGTGVPVLCYERERADDELLPFYEEMNAEQMTDYWRRKNVTSIDGLETGIFGS